MRKRNFAIILFVLFIFGLLVIYDTSKNYIAASKATHNFKAEIKKIEVLEDKVIITFNFTNNSPLTIRIDNIAFNLYVNGRYVGNFGENFAITEKKMELKPGVTEHEIVAKVHPIYFKSIEEERESGTLLWFVVGRIVLGLPFKDFYVLIDIKEFWVGG